MYPVMPLIFRFMTVSTGVQLPPRAVPRLFSTFFVVLCIPLPLHMYVCMLCQKHKVIIWHVVYGGNSDNFQNLPV